MLGRGSADPASGADEVGERTGGCSDGGQESQGGRVRDEKTTRPGQNPDANREVSHLFLEIIQVKTKI